MNAEIIQSESVHELNPISLKNGGSVNELPKKSSAVYISQSPDLDIQYILKKEFKINLIEFKNEDAFFIASNRITPGFFILDQAVALKNNCGIIKKIQSHFQKKEIVIIIAKNETLNILDLLDMGVTQFIQLPCDYEKIMKKIQSIKDRSEIQHLENIISGNNSRALQKQLEWMNYKNIRQNIGLDTAGKNIIEDLRDSLVQVGGYGIMLSMIDVIREVSQMKNESYIVETQLMDILSENARIANKNLNGINKAINIMSENYDLHSYSSYYLIQKIPEILGELSSAADNNIYFPKINSIPDVYININYDILALAIEELMVNAVKYSRPGSAIHMYATMSDNYFCLNIINEYSEMQSEYFGENVTDLLVKPFLRMHPPLDRYLDSEKIGMGLGLTVVYYIMGQMNGLLNISNIQDHTSESIKPSVLTQIFIPVSS